MLYIVIYLGNFFRFKMRKIKRKDLLRVWLIGVIFERKLNIIKKNYI